MNTTSALFRKEHCPEPGLHFMLANLRTSQSIAPPAELVIEETHVMDMSSGGLAVATFELFNPLAKSMCTQTTVSWTLAVSVEACAIYAVSDVERDRSNASAWASSVQCPSSRQRPCYHTNLLSEQILQRTRQCDARQPARTGARHQNSRVAMIRRVTGNPTETAGAWLSFARSFCANHPISCIGLWGNESRAVSLDSTVLWMAPLADSAGSVFHARVTAPKDAQRCLHRNSVLFVGDSLTDVFFSDFISAWTVRQRTARTAGSSIMVM